ncbi:MAG TPA: aspartate 1-decarboxylase [Bryobacteraceae bacterium]|jgi:aspartate 1-decarboxylase
MNLKILKCKIHRVTVTRADINYEGSISIDPALMRAAGIVPYEAIQIWNVSNGQRLETYVIKGEENSGEIGVNGSAARHVQVGDILILAVFCHMDEAEAAQHQPKVVFVDERNRAKA